MTQDMPTEKGRRGSRAGIPQAGERSLVSGTGQPAYAILAWFTFVLGAWAAIHVLNRSVPITTDATPPWLGTTTQHARMALAWLGLWSTHGLARAAVWSCTWLAFQEGGLRLGLAPFTRAPPDLAPAHLLGTLLIAPLFEEVLFRGAMLRALRERGVPRERVVLATAMAFAALHLPGWLSHRGLDPTIMGSFASIAGFGIVLGYLGWISRSLWAPIALHFANNLLSTGALAWLVQQGPGG